MAGRIALYGGSFDPVHNGHLIIARSIAEQLDVQRVILLPSRTPPHKPRGTVASGEHRLAMTRLAVEGEPLFEVSDADLTCEGPSYTANTVEGFRDRLGPGVDLLWIVGADSLLELHTWWQPERIVRHCRVVSALRPGSEIQDLPEMRSKLGDQVAQQLLADIVMTPRIDISATDIRQRVSDERSIRYLVPDAVARYIAEHRLYTSAD